MTIDRAIELTTAFVFGWLLSLVFNSYARGADLPIPKPRPAPEQCVGPDIKPAAGQTMQADPTCPSGYRWKVQK